MALPPIDTHRTGISARIVSGDSCEIVMVLDRNPAPLTQAKEFWYGTPGVMQYLINADGTLFGFNIACPSCGQLRSLMTCERDGTRARWHMKGNPRRIETVTLEPPIKKLCCGWTGSLIQGIFVSLE